LNKINWIYLFNRYEIRDIRLPPKVQEAMQMQVEAEVKDLILKKFFQFILSLET
jgi:regulator of protease activity HflC (stomatin/prohibitin superfamily)